MTDNDCADPGQQRDARPHQQGGAWGHEAHLELIWALRQGYSDDEAAEHLQRTAGGIRARAKRMVDPAVFEVRPRCRPLDVLRELVIADRDYDWERWVDISNAARVWKPAEHDHLRAGWESRTSLPRLADELGATEQEVVRELVRLRIASTTVEITDRLGCEPGGVIDQRSRLAADNASSQVWVLVAHFLDDPTPHVSIHLTSTAAEGARNTLLHPVPGEDLDQRVEARRVTWWCIAQRSPGGTAGRTSTSAPGLPAPVWP